MGFANGGLRFDPCQKILEKETATNFSILAWEIPMDRGAVGHLWGHRVSH